MFKSSHHYFFIHPWSTVFYLAYYIVLLITLPNAMYVCHQREQITWILCLCFVVWWNIDERYGCTVSYQHWMICTWWMGWMNEWMLCYAIFIMVQYILFELVVLSGCMSAINACVITVYCYGDVTCLQ